MAKKIPGNMKRMFAEWECSQCQHQNERRVGDGDLECEACGEEYRIIVIPPKLMKALSRVIQYEVLPDWMSKENPAFDNQTPLQLIEAGQTDRIWQMIHQLESGEPC